MEKTTRNNHQGFKPGNKLASLRKVRAGGRPTREQAAEKEVFRDALIREREEKAEKFVKRYYEFAMKDASTMRHAVDKVLPNKHEVEHSGGIKVHEIRTNVPDED
jgi:hypothetical protein